MEHIYDLVIIGSGPAGLAAAVYAQRARLDTLVIEKAMVSGGQVLTTYEVDNYPGLPGIGGYDLGLKFREHADQLGAAFAEDDVVRIEDQGKIKRVVCEHETYESRALILATGAVHRKLGIPGEEELAGMGVSYCATCDGAFFRNKVTAVIGGGDVAVEDAIFLARMCSKVYLIHRRNELRAAKSLQETLLGLENVEVIWDTVADCINGDGMVRSLSVTNVKTGAKTDLDVQGVFIAVGISPESKAFEGIVDMDHGYIRAGEDGVTSVPGIFAAGDADQAPSPDHYGSSGRRQCSYQRGTVPDRELGGCRANEEVEENTGCQRPVQLCVCSACPGIHQSGDRFFPCRHLRGAEQFLCRQHGA